MNKQQATYTPSLWDNLIVGQCAVICCTSHPTVKDCPKMIITSKVTSLTDNGFETENTQYTKE